MVSVGHETEVEIIIPYELKLLTKTNVPSFNFLYTISFPIVIISVVKLFLLEKFMSKRLENLIARARVALNESQEDKAVELSLEIHVFDFDKTLHNNYKSLQCADMMKQHMSAGVPCFVVTARKPNSGQEKHIVDVCARWGIKINQSHVFCVGDDSKGPVVLDLIRQHQPEFCTFWDDKEENCESVYENCFDACEDLKIYWLSTAVPGDVRKEFGSGPDNERYEKKPTLQERRLFRNWRRLSGI